MRTSTDDIFGGAREPQPALPGSYGEAPAGYRLPEATRLGPVRLQVSDLERSLSFYERVLGLRVLERDGDRAVLGAQGSPATVLVELAERPGVRPAGPRARLGLFHFAILLPDRAGLGQLVRHLAESGVRPGAGDHLVSEAFYLQDPDGLGIEVYADRPRSAWRRVGRELMLSTEPVDVDDLLREAGEARWEGMPAGTTIGHVHLHVGDLEQASAFFSEALGFDRMTWSYPGAVFLGAGGYHHHLGANTWAGSGAPLPDAGVARLLEWTIELPDAASVTAAGRSLDGAGHVGEPAADGEIVTRDPWGTAVRIRTWQDQTTAR
jgi:catechol 2,3-dioxygenase